MGAKENLQKVLNGEIPEKVPHFELGFQLTEEVFGENFPVKEDLEEASEKERDILIEKYLELHAKIREKYNWAAVAIPYRLMKRAKKMFGDKALVYDWNGEGTFWMPTGSDMMDFIVKLFEKRDKLLIEAKKKRIASIELAKKTS